MGGTGWEGVFKDTPSELSPGGEGPAMSRTEGQVLQAENGKGRCEHGTGQRPGAALGSTFAGG